MSPPLHIERVDRPIGEGSYGGQERDPLTLGTSGTVGGEMLCPRCGTVAAGHPVECARCGGSLARPDLGEAAEPPVPRAPTRRGELAQEAAGVVPQILARPSPRPAGVGGASSGPPAKGRDASPADDPTSPSDAPASPPSWPPPPVEWRPVGVEGSWPTPDAPPADAPAGTVAGIPAASAAPPARAAGACSSG